MFQSEESLPISPNVGARIPSQDRVERASAIAESTARHVGRNLPLPPDEWVIVGHWIGKVVAAPDGEDEYTDARYWVEKQKIDPSIAATDAIETLTDTLYDEDADRTVTVTNLAEIASASHSLAVGDTVHVFERDREDGAIHYHMMAASGGGVAFEITGILAGGGKYELTLLAGASTAVATGNLTMPEGMTSGDSTAVGLNTAEDGSASHILPTGMYGIGKIVGMTAGGLPIVMFDMMVNVVIRGTAEKTSGAAGSLATSTTCAFVYTIRNGYSATALATGVSPEKARIPNCAYTVPAGEQPARMYQDVAGVWHLLEVLTERPVTATSRTVFNPVWNSTLKQFDFDQEDVLVLDKKTIEEKASLLFYDCDGNRPE